MIRKLGRWLFPNPRPNPRRRFQPTGHDRNLGVIKHHPTSTADSVAVDTPSAADDQPAEEFSCPVCGTVHAYQSPRYRNHVCKECEKRARCSHDRPIIGYNTHMSGGFEAQHYDRGDNRCDQVTQDHRVWIDGEQFFMDEARFGGTVVTKQHHSEGPYA